MTYLDSEKPRTSKFFNGKAIALEKMNRFEEALQYYDSAIEKNPENSSYFYNRALTLDKMNQFEEALNYYDLAIQISPLNQDYYYGKAVTLFYTKLVLKDIEYEQIG
ncbi:unnamed protein product [Paramecium primaurelia]|uniref:Uncharacterized protein n=1 Tax=Paramecium primaurelia TaxID=5886 RepID=A0A8S1L200_PARPR|nr:unnamed protein product [Paramecium primaurelia]